jgi:hypothetical protein
MSRDLRVPVSCGVLRPTIVLPAPLCEPPAVDKLRWVLGHELTHLQRRDAWSGLLMGLGQALYFYVPCFWWLRRQVRLCQEYIADAAAVERGVPPADYAEFLLSLAHAPAVPAAATGVSGHGSDLYRRVTMLLQDPLRIEKHCPRLWSLGAAGGLLTLAVAVAGIGLRPAPAAAEQPEEKAKEARKVRVIVIADPTEKSKDADVLFKKLTVGAGENAVFQEIGPAEVKVIVKGIGQAEPKDILFKKVGPGEKGIVIKKIAKDDDSGVLYREAKPGESKIIIRRVVPMEYKIIANKVETPMRFGTDGKKVEVNIEAIRKALEKLEKVPGVDVEQIRKEILKALEDVNKATFKLHELKPMLSRYEALTRERALKAEDRAKLAKARVLRFEGEFGGSFGAAGGHERLGIEVEKPAAALADQLNLPKGHGLMVIAVKAGSPARKAGLKANDVLLELAGQTVTSEPGALLKMVEGLQPKSTVDAVVLRKGKRQTVKGIVVAAGQAKVRTRVAPNEFWLTVPDVKASKRRLDAKEKADIPGAAGGTVTVTTVRTNERFTTRYQEGNLVITVVGKGNQPSEITVQDGAVTNTYDSVDSVPARYRDKVNHMIKSATTGSFRIERR